MKFVLLLGIVLLSVLDFSTAQRDQFCQRQPLFVEPGRRCRKPCNSNRDCRGRRKRCLCDGFCGKSCFNPLAKCDLLENFKNGSVEYSSSRRVWKTSVIYKCNKGYSLRGVNLRTCQSDRKWSGKEPFCSDLGHCGQSANTATGKSQHFPFPLVVGGVNADEGAWPWQAVILYERVDVFATFSGGMFGGGSLINKYWVLTAAHVIKELEKREDLTSYLDSTLLAFGYTELPNSASRGSAGGKLYRPRFVIKHPEYEKASVFDYDFALIRIGRESVIDGEEFRDLDEESGGEVVFTDYIRPICLPCTGSCVSPDDIRDEDGKRLLTGRETPEEACEIEGAWLSGRNNPEGVRAFITGFGSTRQRDLQVRRKTRSTTRLQQGALNINSDSDCQDAMTRFNQYQIRHYGRIVKTVPYTKQMICAKAENTSSITDACQGDSGGPLMREIKDADGVRKCWVQVGVVSFGFGCAWKSNGYSYPGFYADISSILYWMNNCKNRLTDAARSDNLTCDSGVQCRALRIPDGIDARTDDIPFLIEGFEVSSHTLMSFSCVNDEAVLVGPSVVTCLPNGTWSSPYPTHCERRCILSSLSEDIGYESNRDIIPQSGDQYQIGNVIAFYCKERQSILVGNPTVRCLENATWSGPLPTACVERYTYCYGVGDPHYTSFDGKRFDFQGTCSYTLVKNSTADVLRPSFEVEVDNENRGGNTRVSWLKKAYIKISQNKIELNKGRVVKVNGAVVNLPYYSPRGEFHIKFSGRFVQIEANFGMAVSYDGNSYIAVGLSKSLANKVEGLCGNFNGNRSDDFLLTDSTTITDDVVVFGNQYQTKTKKNCQPYFVPEGSDVCNRRAQFEEQCSIISNDDESRCFSGCVEMVNPTSYFENCVFDSCAYNDYRSALETNGAAYVKACQDVGARICDNWREEAGIPYHCPPNSHYSSCASRCPQTCTNHDTNSCNQACVEGCVCEVGHVLSGDLCVPKENCGCLYHGLYYKQDEKFYDDDRCSSYCHCRNQTVTCKEKSCRNEEVCGRNNDGIPACVAAGEATCWGGTQYRTFDGTMFHDFIGSCSFILSQTVGIKPTLSKWFTILSNSDGTIGNTSSSHIQSVTIKLRSNITVELGRDGLIMFNGERVQGIQSNFFTVQPYRRSVRFNTRLGLAVSFKDGEIKITIPSTYVRKVTGICGNYNGNPDDELEIEGRNETLEFYEFASSHKFGECDIEPRQARPCSEFAQIEATRYCEVNMLTRGAGFFQSCHELVDPQPFITNCVLEYCAPDRHGLSVAKRFEPYAEHCLSQGARVCDWRLQTDLDIECPPNSHYVGCASPCPNTCQSPHGSSNCQTSGYVEDCVCNVGYLRDGNRCVRPELCGNVEEGVYSSKDLCAENNGGCGHNCTDDARGVTCTCAPGYNVTEDGACNKLGGGGIDAATSRLITPQNMTAIFDNWNNYAYDGGSSHIGDGGSDMYDNGNYVNLYKNGEAVITSATYNQTYRFNDAVFRATATHPFMALLHVENRPGNRVNFTIQVRGGTGADRRGRIVRFNNTISRDGFNLSYFSFQVHDASTDPSICEVYFTIHSEEEWRSVPPEEFDVVRFSRITDPLENSVEIVGNPQNIIFGYLLLSRRRGATIDKIEVDNYMHFLLSQTSVESRNCSDDNGMCEDTCIQLTGGYICNCSVTGTYLAPDYRSCDGNAFDAREIAVPSALTARDLSTVLPSFNQYRYDGAGQNKINDGGSDMYDTGNKINIYKNEQLAISDAVYNQTYRYSDYVFRATSSYPFMALLQVNNEERNRVNFTIQVYGGTGADGSGKILRFNNTIRRNTFTLSYFSFQVFEAGNDPSICEVYFTIYSEEVWRSIPPEVFNAIRFSRRTDPLDNSVEIVGTPQNVILGYTLLSRTRAKAFTELELANYMSVLLKLFIKDENANCDINNGMCQDACIQLSGAHYCNCTQPESSLEFDLRSCESNNATGFGNPLVLGDRDLSTVLPSFYRYRYDGGRTQINDGGSDMYDTGNKIHLYKNGLSVIAEAQYNQTYKSSDYIFRATSSYPFMALLQVKNKERNRVNFTIQVSGGTGADRRGIILTFNNTISRGTFHMQYHVFQIHNAGDPTICEVYFTVYSEEVWRSIPAYTFSVVRFSAVTDPLDNSVNIVGTPRNVMLGYTLLSRARGVVISEIEVLNYMSVLLDLFRKDPTRTCAINNGGCEDTCIQLASTYLCNCTRPGTSLSLDLRTCDGVFDETFLNLALLIGRDLDRIIPSSYRYAYDGNSVNSIHDGGNDMFDAGNMIRIYEGSNRPSSAIPYGTTRRYASYEFSISERGSHPFIALAWVRNPRGESKSYSIQVNGNLGADNRGQIAVYRGQFDTEGSLVEYRVFHVHSANDPSVCEVYFTIGRGNWSSVFPRSMIASFSNSTDAVSNLVRISGTPRNILFGYVLLSRRSGRQIPEANVVSFLREMTSYITSGPIPSASGPFSTITSTTSVPSTRATTTPSPLLVSPLVGSPALLRALQTTRSSTPSWNNYRYDQTGPVMYRLSDGGSDMYDNGNMVSLYTDNVRLINAQYNRSYSYDNINFTTMASHPFVAIAWIGDGNTANRVYQLRVSGNAGADSRGVITTGSDEILVEDESVETRGDEPIRQLYEMSYSFFQVSNATDPSICEVYFLIQSSAWGSVVSQNFQANFGNVSTDRLNNSITLRGSPSNVIMGYTLLSKTRGVPFTASEIREIMRTYLNALGPQGGEPLPTLFPYTHAPTTTPGPSTRPTITPTPRLVSSLNQSDALLRALDEITSTTPRWYKYRYDQLGVMRRIADGGSDMYDGGNRVSVYTDDVRLTDVEYNRSYSSDNFNFTTWAGHPFVALLWVGDNSVSNQSYEIRVRGDAGADGRGIVTTERGWVVSGEAGTYSMRYSSFQVSNATDSSICEVYFFIESRNWFSSPVANYRFSFVSQTNTLNNAMTVQGNLSNILMGYILLSKQSGIPYGSGEIHRIMRLMMEALGPQGGLPIPTIFPHVHSYVNATSPPSTTTARRTETTNRPTTQSPGSPSRLGEDRALVAALDNITSSTPRWYNYVYDYRGVDRNRISDGGNDMYDTGNMITVSSNNFQVPNAQYNRSYSSGGLTFSTLATHPFVALLDVRESANDFFEIHVNGNAGADGRGSISTGDGVVIGGPRGLDRMRYGFFQVSHASDPSICEVYFLIDNQDQGRTLAYNFNFGNSTNQLNNTFIVRGRAPLFVMGYILLSKLRGEPYTLSEIRRIMEILLNGLVVRDDGCPRNVEVTDCSSIVCDLNSRPCVGQRRVPYSAVTTRCGDNLCYCAYFDNFHAGDCDVSAPSSISYLPSDPCPANAQVYEQAACARSPCNRPMSAPNPCPGTRIKFSNTFSLQCEINKCYCVYLESYNAAQCTVGGDVIPTMIFPPSGTFPPPNVIGGSEIASQVNISIPQLNRSISALYLRVAEQFIPQFLQDIFPNWYNYQFDDTTAPINSIIDGGNDMYDTGNQVRFFKGRDPLPFNVPFLNYSSTYRRPSYDVAVSGQTYPFMVFAYLYPSPTRSRYVMEVVSNFGADGDGLVARNTGNVLVSNFGSGVNLTYHSFQVYNTSEPSVCEVFFMAHDTRVNQPVSFTVSHFSIFSVSAVNRVIYEGATQNVVLGYTLLSQKRGQRVETHQIEEFLERFVSMNPARG